MLRICDGLGFEIELEDRTRHITVDLGRRKPLLPAFRAADPRTRDTPARRPRFRFETRLH
jgi:hypothetical protein